MGDVRCVAAWGHITASPSTRVINVRRRTLPYRCATLAGCTFRDSCSAELSPVVEVDSLVRTGSDPSGVRGHSHHFHLGTSAF